MKDLKSYLSLGSSVNAHWLKDNRMVYVNTDENGRSLILKDLNSKDERVLYSTPERILKLYTHAESGYIFFSADIGGTENEQIFVIKNIGDEPLDITNELETRHYIGGLHPDRKRLVIASNSRKKQFFDIVSINIENGEKELVLKNEDNYNIPDAISPDGKYITYNKLLGGSDNAMWMVDVDTGKAVKTPATEEKATFTQAQWKSDSSGFYLITDLDSDFQYIAYYDVESKTMEKLYGAKWDVDRIALSPNDKYMAIIVNEGGYSKLSVYDTENKVLLNTPLPPKGVYSGYDALGWSGDGERLLFSLSSGTRPQNIWLLDIKNDSVMKITECHMAGLTSEDFTEPSLHEFESFDGLKVPYWLYVPKNTEAKNLPVMIDIHGGPEGQSRPALTNPFTQYMVSQGIAVVQPNVRGSTGYGKIYSHLDDVEKRLDSVKDIEYLVKHLIETGVAHKDKLGVCGGSYGGFMTLSCIARYPDLWCCAVDTVGMFNLATFLENTAAYRRPHRESEYGTLEHHRDILLKVSPIDKVDDIKGPLMIIHGENDPRVPVSEAHQATDYLKKRGVEVELIVYPDEGHGISKLKNKLDCYPKVIDFIKEHMKI